MIFNKIWERYFLRETSKVFFLFIFSFYGLYILIDYSSHASSFHHHHIQFQWKEVALYYVCEFIRRFDVLIPFAILIACIRTLCTLNVHNELVALMASGVRLKTLLRPFVFIGLFFTAVMYLNTEYLVPHALREIKHIDDTHTSEKNKNNQQPSVQHVVLDDNTTLIFQNFDSARNLFFDAYWIRSINDIYRIKYLYPYTEVPAGHFVDHLIRNQKGELVATESFDSRAFPEIHFNKKVLLETLTPADEQPFSDLWKNLPNQSNDYNEKEARVLTAFYGKLVMPWLCLLAVIGPIPFCVRFTRHLSVFFIYAGSIFGLVAFYLIMDAAFVLGNRQVLPPLWAVWTPFLLFFVYFGWRFVRLR